jgi:hypothetical protein
MFVFWFQICNENSFKLYNNNIGLYISCNNNSPHRHILYTDYSDSNAKFRDNTYWETTERTLSRNSDTLELLFSWFQRASLLMLFLLLGLRIVWMLVAFPTFHRWVYPTSSTTWRQRQHVLPKRWQHYPELHGSKPQEKNRHQNTGILICSSASMIKLRSVHTWFVCFNEGN